MAQIVQFMYGDSSTYTQKYQAGGLKGVIFFGNDQTIWKDGKIYGQISQGDATWDAINKKFGGAFNQIISNSETNGKENNGYIFSFVDVNGNSNYSVEIPVANASLNGLMSSSDFSKLASINAEKIVYQEDGKGLSSNDFTDAYKNQLDSIEAGAQVNIIEKIKVDHTLLEVTDKTVDIPLTDKIGEIIGTKLTTAYEYKGSVADSSELPSTGNKIGDVYNIQTESEYGSAGVNVAWTGTQWDSLGGIFDTTDIDAKISSLQSTTSDLNTKYTELKPVVDANKQAIDILNSNSTTEGSVSYTATEIANTIVTNYLTWEELT